MLVFGYLSDKIGTSIPTSIVFSPSFTPHVFQDGNLEWLVDRHPRISIVDLD